ncbi:MAG: chain length-determining protein [Burkholderiales bacterium]|nr:chain length-determining protein [Burkholderiales bacterium]
MDELLQHALTTLRGMWHRRWIGLAVAWLVGIVAVTAALRTPERYEASARVYVDTQTLLRPLMEGLSIQPNLEQQVVLLSRTLISRPNVEKVVRAADLDLAVPPSAREDLIDSVTAKLKLGAGAGNIYALSYRDSNPEQARKVVQSLLTIFMESSLGDKRQDTRAAVRFVDEQIKQYEESLRAAENRLKEFRLKYLGVAGQGGPDYFGRLAKLTEDISEAKRELRAAEESRDAYKRELAGETAVLLPEPQAPAPPAAISVPAIDARLATLRTELDNLTRRFTDQHPDVIQTKRNIEALEEQRRQEEAAIRRAQQAASKAHPETRVDRNPVFQQLKVSLADAEAQVASLRAKVASYDAQYAQLRNSARMVPQIEAEYTQLNRDYEIQKKVYETLLARKQSATIGEGVQDFGGTQFRVIDPPRVLPEPVPPTRTQLLLVAFLGAIGAGLLAAFVASQLLSTFHDARTLREITKRPILGMVTMLQSAALSRARRRNGVLFAGGVGSLLVSFVAVFMMAGMLSRFAG